MRKLPQVNCLLVIALMAITAAIGYAIWLQLGTAPAEP